MENRDRDKLSRNTGSTSGGDVNRNTSSKISKEKSGSSTEFGQKIGQSENRRSDMQGDSGRSSGSSGLGSSSSRSGSSDLGENVESTQAASTNAR